MADRFSETVWALVLGATCVLAAQTQPPPSPTGDRARAESLSKRASTRLAALQKEADRLAADERSLLNDLRRLEVERQLKAAEVARVDREVQGVQKDLEDTQRKIASLQASEARARPELRARLVEIYKLGRARYARLLLSTADLRRLGQASRTVAALAKADRDRIAEHERMIQALAKNQATLEERKTELAAARRTAEAAQASAARAAQAQTDLIHELDRRRDLNAQLAGELQAAQQKLQAAMHDSATGGGATEVGLPLAPFRGDLDWPVAGQLKRRFGQAARGESPNGIEVVAADGTQATAIHEGVVAFSGSFAGFGNLVIVDHGAQTFSVYRDLLETAADKGARVDRGQPVGVVGPLPSGGTGLYFELRVDGRPVDPLQWLKKRTRD